MDWRIIYPAVVCGVFAILLIFCFCYQLCRRLIRRNEPELPTYHHPTARHTHVVPTVIRPASNLTHGTRSTIVRPPPNLTHGTKPTIVRPASNLTHGIRPTSKKPVSILKHGTRTYNDVISQEYNIPSLYLSDRSAFEAISNSPTFYDSPPISPPISPPNIQRELLHLKHATKSYDEVFFDENGTPCLDLHDMIVPEARDYYKKFIQKHEMLGTDSVKIITGRGIHSQNRQPVLKPEIENILREERLDFNEVSNGGAFLVYLTGDFEYE